MCLLGGSVGSRSQSRCTNPKSPERVLAWSDPETFTLRREHKVESVPTAQLVPIDRGFLMEGYCRDGWDDEGDAHPGHH